MIVAGGLGRPGGMVVTGGLGRDEQQPEVRGRYPLSKLRRTRFEEYELAVLGVL